MKRYDPSAIGSDTPRSFKQYLARRFASFLVTILGLNKAGFLATEIVQQIAPICTLHTKYGDIRCRGGHGRLTWRVRTFYSEEPETIEWLESLRKDDYLWDVGANVGLYSIYAARCAKCKILAIEPEAQNYAILLENVVMNNVQELIEATNLPISNIFAIGKLAVHAVTKGGAYNRFIPRATSGAFNSELKAVPITQVQICVSLDDLVSRFNYACPTHLKIDVDGNEPDIIAGASTVLQSKNCRSVLIEIQRNDPKHAEAVQKLLNYGFRCVSKRSNWESRTNREREEEHPAVNMVFKKGA